MITFDFGFLSQQKLLPDLMILQKMMLIQTPLGQETLQTL
jgi:hypothetical protein